MKKIVYTTIGILMFFAASVQAQNVNAGIKAGVNLADWGGDAKQSFSDVLELSSIAETQMKTGYHVGGYLSIPVGNRLVIEPALLYSTKGMKVVQTLVGNSIFNVKAEITDDAHYLDLPVVAKVFIADGFHLYGGPQLSYLISNKLEAEAGVFGFSLGEDFKLDRGLRKFDIGLAAGLGYQFQNGINLGAGYDYGLTSLDEGAGNFDVFNRVLKFSVGYTF